MLETSRQHRTKENPLTINVSYVYYRTLPYLTYL